MDLIDIGIYISYALLFVAVLAMIVLPLMNAVKSPGNMGKSAVGVGALVVLFIIAFVLSGSDVTAGQQAAGVTEFGSRLIGAGLTMFYFVFIIAIGSMFYSEVSKALK